MLAFRRTCLNKRELKPKSPATQVVRSKTSPIRFLYCFPQPIHSDSDQTWKLLKSFSLLVVKDGKGSMHRLLAQALRMSQNEQEGTCNLEICLQALLQAWTFKAEQVETWAESTTLLEHVKAVVVHTTIASVETATLSREAGVFSAMALNRFEEAQFSLEHSLRILDGVGKTETVHFRARAAALHELGRVLRYEGNFKKSEEALRKALEIRNRLARENLDARHEVAATLHELGVLEVKKHNLDSAATFLQQALDLRRSLDLESPLDGVEADCASTLHQLAAVQVAMKPPSLDRAEALLQEALGLHMQIGQRAATLKQLARVAMRRGEFNSADRSLAMALELYNELYGEGTLHINTAAVRFQQGALALQREQLDQAWIHFSECLRARRHVYAYSQGNHLEVSTVLHELACVAFAQKRISKACEMLLAEKEILECSHRQRMLQARLTNLTWLRKCAKEQGDEEQVRRIVAERSELKRTEKQQTSEIHIGNSVYPSPTLSLEQEALQCRLAARQFALSKPEAEMLNREQLNAALINLLKEIDRSPASSLREATVHFHEIISESLTDDLGSNKRSPIFEACDDFRDILRDHGLQVNDIVQSKQ
jgi:tetratricopeptide (TPR) repeat protein